MHRAFVTVVSSVAIGMVSILPTSAERNNDYVVTHKYGASVDDYFDSPHLQTARWYWEDKKIIDLNVSATLTLAQQLGYAAGSQRADVFIPDNYDPDKPAGIYIHINHSDAASLPQNLQGVLQSHNLIGASPDNAGNDRHDPERLARALDLAVSLQAQYEINDERIYIGGISGGGLISILAGMLYPDTFRGVIATEHAMGVLYWRKAFGSNQIAEMAARKQRWVHILGKDSYAYSALAPWTTDWKCDSGSRWEDGELFRTYEPLFDTMNIHVPDMTHVNPFPADFEKAILFVDGPYQEKRALTYQDWEQYALRSDAPDTVFVTHSIDHERPVAPDPTLNRGPEDDFDQDGIPNWQEYLMGTDPNVASPPFGVRARFQGTTMVMPHRLAALDLQMMMETSTDLQSWDAVSAANHTVTDVPAEEGAMGETHLTPLDGGAKARFYQSRLVYEPLQNLTQFAGVTATQSSTAWDGHAEHAIDGNRDGIYASGSTTHTNTTGQNWWQVDLGGTYELSRIQIFNRTGFENRLANYRVSVLSPSSTVSWSQDFYRNRGHTGAFERITLPAGTRGRRVRVSTLGTNPEGNTILSLAEVEVWGRRE